MKKVDLYTPLPIYHFADEIKKNHAKKKMRCAVFGDFGTMNTGEEGMLAGNIRELRTIPNLKITVVARFPKEIKRLHGISAISQSSIKDIVREVKRSDFIVIGGGLLNNSFISQLSQLFTFLLIPRFYKKKLYVVGFGVYERANWFILAICSFFLRQALLLTVRDTYSHTVLKRKDVRSLITKDNSYLMELLPKQTIAAEGYFANNLRSDRRNIALALVAPTKRKERNAVVSELATYIAKQYQTTDFWFYSLDYQQKHLNDVVFAHKVVALAEKKAGKKIPAHFVPHEAHPQKVFSSFQVMDGMIAMHFHAMLFSYRINLPFIGLPYDTKGRDFLRMIGKEGVSLSKLRASMLQTRLKPLN